MIFDYFDETAHFVGPMRAYFILFKKFYITKYASFKSSVHLIDTSNRKELMKIEAVFSFPLTK